MSDEEKFSHWEESATKGDLMGLLSTNLIAIRQIQICFLALRTQDEAEIRKNLDLLGTAADELTNQFKVFAGYKDG